MGNPSAVAIYARISSDAEGTGLGVARQVKDCRKLAKSLGWTIADEYVDNDVSAYSGKRRPEYARMMDDLQGGRLDGVICYHVDRLTRRPVELEQFVTALDEARVKNVKFVAGDMDLGTGDGLMIARMMGAMAAHESATKSRRILRKMQERAEAGQPNMVWNRPCGYEDDKVTIRESEAAVLRTVVDRFLAGESMRSLATWLNSEGHVTPYDKPWTTSALRRILRSGRIAGLREHHGEVVATAVWPGIITVEQRQRILTQMEQRHTANRRAVQSYLLTGMVRCGRCGNRLFSSRRENSRRYVCLSGPDHGGCGRLTVVADPLERWIAEAVLYRLDTPELADALTGRTAQDQHTAQVAEDLGKQRARLDELAQMFGDGEIGRREWLAARKPIDARINEAERRLARASGTGALRGIIGQGTALRDSWADLNLGRQHAIVAAVLDHAVITPGVSGARSLDPERVQPVWRL